MEIEDIQDVWAQMSTELEHQKKLTNTIIIKMTQEKFKNKFKILTRFETIGAIVCFVFVVVILINFNKLDTWYHAISGILAIGLLATLPTLVLKSLFKIQNLNITTGDYKTNLVTYIKEKNKLLKLQRIGIGLSFVMFFLILIINPKIASNKDIFLSDFDLGNLLGLLVALPFIVLMSLWGYRSYKRITSSAASILKELE